MHLSAFFFFLFFDYFFFTKNRLKDLNVRSQGLKCKYENYRDSTVKSTPKIKNYKKWNAEFMPVPFFQTDLKTDTKRNFTKVFDTTQN
jgi:hypothetical protein